MMFKTERMFLFVWAVVVIVLASSIYALSEGCDSTTNANCVETNSTNSDLCTVGVAGAVQTQILGISAGATVRDMNCERLKNAKVLYDMGMKVAAVSVMCQDKRIFASMMNAGTPCPFDGLVGTPAKQAWLNNPELIPGAKSGTIKEWSDDDKATAKGAAGVGGLLALLLLLL